MCVTHVGDKIVRVDFVALANDGEGAAVVHGRRTTVRHGHAWKETRGRFGREPTIQRVLNEDEGREDNVVIKTL